MHTSCLIFIVVIVFVNGDNQWPKTATCKFTRQLRGEITLTQQNLDAPVKLEGSISRLSIGPHGMHVHEFGDLSGNGCESVGDHYNPKGTPHGAPSDVNRHVGDLGNIDAHSKGGAEINMTNNYLTLCGSFSIVGRSIVIHQGKDDLGRGGQSNSLYSGNSGPPYDCCVIKLRQQ